MLNFIKSNKVNTTFRESCDNYYESIFKYCCCLLDNENDAKDCTQETFARYLVRLEKNDPIENHRAYLYKIAKSVCIQHSRQVERHNKDILNYLDVENVIDTLSVEEQIELQKIENHIDEIVMGILNTLSTKDKALYSDYFIHKLTLKQIAYNQNVSETTIWKRIKAIKRTIEKLVRETINKGGDLHG